MYLIHFSLFWHCNFEYWVKAFIRFRDLNCVKIKAEIDENANKVLCHEILPFESIVIMSIFYQTVKNALTFS